MNASWRLRCHVAGAAVTLALSAPVARADAPMLEIEAPSSLHAGEVANLVVVVRLPDASAAPLLLTPSAAGDAIEIARGRLLRSDATTANAGELRFALPLILKAAGTAVLRVELSGYRCNERCELVHAAAQRPLQVAPGKMR